MTYNMTETEILTAEALRLAGQSARGQAPDRRQIDAVITDLVLHLRHPEEFNFPSFSLRRMYPHWQFFHSPWVPSVEWAKSVLALDHQKREGK